jgi:hypothetical protein
MSFCQASTSPISGLGLPRHRPIPSAQFYPFGRAFALRISAGELLVNFKPMVKALAARNEAIRKVDERV